MMRLSEDELERRAKQIAERLRANCPSLQIEVVESRSVLGGGAAPGSTLPTRVLAVKSASITPMNFAHARQWETPIIARVEEGRVLLDLRTVEPATGRGNRRRSGEHLEVKWQRFTPSGTPRARSTNSWRRSRRTTSEPWWTSASFPMSRRMPHFNRESLEVELPKHGIAYVWMKELGGRRKKIRDDSPNTGLRNDSFRNYADYMLTEEFAQGIERLLGIALRTADPSAPLGMTSEKGDATNTAIMCAERMYFQCHRMLVSDYLTAHGHTVLHIDDDKRPLREHKLMAEAHLVDGQLLYNAQELF